LPKARARGPPQALAQLASLAQALARLASLAKAPA
jgi:hypothetical protein